LISHESDHLKRRIAFGIVLGLTRMDFLSSAWLKRSMARRAMRFLAHRRGSVSMTFALSASVAMLTVAAAVDYGRAVTSNTSLQTAVDAVALKAMQDYSNGVRDPALTTSAATYLTALTHDASISLDTGYPSLNAAGNAICVKASKALPTTLMRIANVDTVTIRASACSTVNGVGTVEVALVLDTTGSMTNKTSDGVTKLSAMQTAANSFVDYMFDTSPLKTGMKMSVVPFAPTVNIGTDYAGSAWFDLTGASDESFRSPAFARDSSVASSRFGLFTKLKAIRSSWDWTGCVEARTYPYNVTDAAPVVGTPDSYFVPLLAPDEPDAQYTGTITQTYYDWSKGRYVTTTTTGTVNNSNSYDNSYLNDNGGTCTSSPSGETLADETTKQSRLCKYSNGSSSVSNSSTKGPNRYCNSASLVRMQTGKTTLQTKISALAANGQTNIHQGFMWGWHTISPNAPFTDGKAYGASNNMKVIVLMTDGENTWNSASNVVDKSSYSAYGYYKNANTRLSATNQNVGSETDARAAMDQLTREACANARAQGITIYTVGFSGKSDPIDDAGKQLLTDCAGDSRRAFFTNSSTGLVSAFQQISAGIGSGSLRLIN
jgi:Flp pilus assembly protein TadG